MIDALVGSQSHQSLWNSPVQELEVSQAGTGLTPISGWQDFMIGGSVDSCNTKVDMRASSANEMPQQTPLCRPFEASFSPQLSKLSGSAEVCSAQPHFEPASTVSRDIQLTGFLEFPNLAECLDV